MFDILFVRRHRNRKNNDSQYEEDVAYIVYMEVILKGVKSNPHGIKQMSYQIEKSLERKVNFLGKCTIELDRVGEYL